MVELSKRRISVPSNETISSFIKMINRRSPWYSGRDIVPEETRGVYLVQEDGTFLGIGNVGRYDWFYQTSDKDGQMCNKTLHHFPPWSSRKHNIAVVNADTFYVKPTEFNILMGALKLKK